MSDTELLSWWQSASWRDKVNAVGRRVMGWYEERREWIDPTTGDVRGHICDHNKDHEPVKAWNPLESIADAWEVLANMKARLFSVRQQFLADLTTLVRARLQVAVAWPDLLLWITPEDICMAALLTVNVVSSIGERT